MSLDVSFKKGIVESSLDKKSTREDDYRVAVLLNSVIAWVVGPEPIIILSDGDIGNLDD